MKYLLALFLFVIALSCGSVTSHAQGIDFHTTVLDPTCPIDNSVCGVDVSDLGVPFPVSFTQQNCTTEGINGPGGSIPYGCFIGTNFTGGTITSFSLDFTSSALLGATCDTQTPGITFTPTSPITGPAFGVSGCTPDRNGGFDVSFSGGNIVYPRQFVILEIGVTPCPVGTVSADCLSASATADPTPEPNSLLLLSTGVMMSGLYLAKRQRLFAFRKR